MAQIELSNPYPEEDLEEVQDKIEPSCLEKLPNGMFKSSKDKVSDFKETFKHKFIISEDDMNKYKHNEEKDEEDYKRQKTKN